jgi:hypothetical protein
MELLQFLQEHMFELIGGVSIITFLSVLYRRFIVSVIPMILKWIKKTVIKVIADAFGFEIDEEDMDKINKLPFVEKFDKLSEDIQIQNELKLVELAQKLNSPLYTELEKIPILNVYNSLYEKIKPQISQETLDILEMLKNR